MLTIEEEDLFIFRSYNFYRRRKRKVTYLNSRRKQKTLNLPGQVWKLICDSSNTPTHETPLGISL